MIKFFAPWCGHCKQFAPEYAKAAKMAKEKGYIFAEVDATQHRKSAEKYKIKGFPTVKLILNGEEIDYEGDRKAEPILEWIEKKKVAEYDVMDNIEQIEQLKKKDTPSILLIAKKDDKESIGIFNKLVKKNDHFAFYAYFTEETPSFVKKNPSYVMIKSYDTQIVEYEGMAEVSPINEFFKQKAVPVLGKFTDKMAGYIFGDGKNALFIFSTPEFLESIKTDVYQLAIENLGKLIFSTSGVSEGME